MGDLLSQIRKISLHITAKIETLKVKIYRDGDIKIKKLYAPGNIRNKIKSKHEIWKNSATHMTKDKSEYQRKPDKDIELTT